MGPQFCFSVLHARRPWNNRKFPPVTLACTPPPWLYHRVRDIDLLRWPRTHLKPQGATISHTRARIARSLVGLETELCCVTTVGPASYDRGCWSHKLFKIKFVLSLMSHGHSSDPQLPRLLARRLVHITGECAIPHRRLEAQLRGRPNQGCYNLSSTMTIIRNSNVANNLLPSLTLSPKQPSAMIEVVAGAPEGLRELGPLDPSCQGCGKP